jgi:hypothetical protein
MQQKVTMTDSETVPLYYRYMRSTYYYIPSVPLTRPIPRTGPRTTAADLGTYNSVICRS